MSELLTTVSPTIQVFLQHYVNDDNENNRPDVDTYVDAQTELELSWMALDYLIRETTEFFDLAESWIPWPIGAIDEETLISVLDKMRDAREAVELDGHVESTEVHHCIRNLVESLTGPGSIFKTATEAAMLAIVVFDAKHPGNDYTQRAEAEITHTLRSLLRRVSRKAFEDAGGNLEFDLKVNRLKIKADRMLRGMIATDVVWDTVVPHLEPWIINLEDQGLALIGNMFDHVEDKKRELDV